MPDFIRLSGPYGPLLSLMALVVLIMVARSIWDLRGGADSSGADAPDRLNAILFWGFASAVLGFLGQCHGTFQAVSQILDASEISMAVVAQGFVISFLPTLYGMGILAFALVCWACLRFLSPRPGFQPAALPALFALLLTLLGCSPAVQEPGPADLFHGVWVMNAGADRFLWEFSPDPVACVVHAVRDGRLLNDTPCAEAGLEGDQVRVRMDTGVRLEGRLDLSRRAIVGGLAYPDGSSTEQELEWAPVSRYPSLDALSGRGGGYAYAPPPETGDGWAVSPAAEAGVDPGALEETVRSVARGDAGVIHSLLVARGGRLVLEEYFHGYGPDDLHPLASCTKSVSSLLVGVAIQNGAISGGFEEAVRTPLLTFLPQESAAAGRGWDALTLEDLLTMTMALDWSPDQAQNLHATGPEAFRQILARNVSGTPGADFEYASINVNLLAGILRNTTGMQAEAYAEANLFHPLGIRAWDWNGLKTEGYNLMDGSLRLRPRDMAKLGAMVQAGGRWRDRQVVDEEWIRMSTAWILDAGSETEGYGYLWWRMDAPGPDGSSIPAIFANGWGSQFIAIFPGLDLVVVTTGGNEYNGKHLAVAGVLAERLLPGVG